jgi:hypothetical protein
MGRRRPAAIELIGQACQKLASGAARPRLWLPRVRQVRVALATIQRVFCNLGMPRLHRPRKREPRQMPLFEKASPGDLIRVDVKFVKIAGRRASQYTALDGCTPVRVLRLYRRLHAGASLAFLAELHRAFPVPIKRLRSDHGVRVLARLRSCRGSRGHPPPPHSARAPPNKPARSSGAIASTRRAGGENASTPSPPRPLACGAGSPGTLRTLLPRPPRPDAGRETCRGPPPTSGRRNGPRAGAGPLPEFGSQSGPDPTNPDQPQKDRYRTRRRCPKTGVTETRLGSPAPPTPAQGLPAPLGAPEGRDARARGLVAVGGADQPE